MSKQTALLGIMDDDTFKTRTKATHAVGGFMSKFKSRGGDMAAIDLALEAWTLDCDSKIAGSQKLARVSAIASACDQWFSQKSSKSTDLSSARSQVIAEVRRACVKAQQYLKNVATAESKTPNGMSSVRRAGTKGLGTGYSHERANYVAGGKTAHPYSASALGEDVATMSYNEFTEAGAAGGERVEFLNRKQRLDYLVTIQGGMMHRNGELINSGLSKTIVRVDGKPKEVPGIYMDTYAMDRYGNVYSKELKGIGELYFNHSSYCAGKAVICAGTLGCVNGKLVYVSNLSGHYKPNTGFLRQFLHILAEEGVDLSEVLVESADTGRAMKALTLLGSPGAAQDWPHWSGKNPMIMYKGDLAEVKNPQ